MKLYEGSSTFKSAGGLLNSGAFNRLLFFSISACTFGSCCSFTVVILPSSSFSISFSIPDSVVSEFSSLFASKASSF